MTVLYPAWLLVALPLAAALLVWRPVSRLITALRITLFVLVTLALAGLALSLPSRAGTLVVVADRSLSMPANHEVRSREVIDLIASKRPADSQLAVVSFARKTGVDMAPARSGFGGFTADVGGDASNLADAIERATSLVPDGSPGRIVVVSDGRATGREPSPAALRAADRGIAVDYRFVSRRTSDDVAIARIDAPTSIYKGEAFLVGATIHSPVPQEVAIELRRDGKVVAAGRKQVPTGESQLVLRDRADAAGTLSYTLLVAGQGLDPVPENNRARFLVGVRGTKPVLVAQGTAGSGLGSLLARGGLDIDARPASQIEWSVERLSGYSAVILENVPAEMLGRRGMENVAAWVKDAGGGVMMTGGQRSFGAGGWFTSPLDPVLPVSMELRREHRKFAVAIVVALDRSGSMAISAGGGKTKMDLANLAAVQTLEMLSPVDEFGAIAVDSAVHHVVDLAPVEENSGARQKILSITSEGGGIYVYEALSYAARMLAAAQSDTRHLILFADAADSEEPGAYKELLEKTKAANMTVSVVGLGLPTDVDANLLRDIATRGGGRAYFTNDPAELPRIFAEDTMVVSRSTFVDTPAAVKLTGGMLSLSGRSFDNPPLVGGYNLTYLRPGAILAGVTVDEQNAPLVAGWQVGLGRALAWTGEADGRFTGGFSSWPQTGELLTSLARWTAGEQSALPEGMFLTQQLRNGVEHVELQIDPSSQAALASTPSITILRGRPGSAPVVEKASMKWQDPETLAFDIQLDGSETVLPTVEIPGGAKVPLSPSVLPYSPEFAPADPEAGAALLGRLARITGGRERVSPAEVWRDLPKLERRIELRSWLLLAAMMLLLLEVLERRTGALGLIPAARRRVRREPETPEPKRVTRAQAPKAQRGESTEPPKVDSEPAAPEQRPALEDALRRARQRAKDRTGN